jgi:hypothetical protein
MIITQEVIVQILERVQQGDIYLDNLSPNYMELIQDLIDQGYLEYRESDLGRFLPTVHATAKALDITKMQVF